MSTSKTQLIGLDLAGLGDVLREIGIPDKQISMRRSQLWNWMYVRGESDFANMLNLSKDLRATLSKHCSVDRPEIVTEQISRDGTRKWLLRFAPDSPGGQSVEVETVYIPESDRGTLCVSSQVGCSLTCTFCHTGTQKMVRNLTSGEILAQVLVARDCLADFPGQVADPATIAPREGKKVSNIVMMGMGEPLLNFENVKQALLIALDDDGLAFSRRRITLSTSGVVPAIYRTGEEIGVGLAISLHAVNDELRDVLVPINRKYPIAQLLKACEVYPGVSNTRRITFEYVMLDGVNDSLADARGLVEMLREIPSKINLIPFNPWPGSEYKCSSRKKIDRFASYLNKHGYVSPVRTPRGQDIMAACGQLKSASEKESKRKSLVEIDSQ
ncbi:23S rRNA (adenine(2503)-C(2))-methyltransferase RlmN [Mariniblastus fucicola]|nr:23S rRNA (adenine(2503)-C(2))-methyltransferase RlmN [Mariniblastus fucicola]